MLTEQTLASLEGKGKYELFGTNNYTNVNSEVYENAGQVNTSLSEASSGFAGSGSNSTHESTVVKTTYSTLETTKQTILSEKAAAEEALRAATTEKDKQKYNELIKHYSELLARFEVILTDTNNKKYKNSDKPIQVVIPVDALKYPGIQLKR